eukprot:3161530-Lingulodinium_polyedra.AAC.1
MDGKLNAPVTSHGPFSERFAACNDEPVVLGFTAAQTMTACPRQSDLMQLDPNMNTLPEALLRSRTRPA